MEKDQIKAKEESLSEIKAAVEQAAYDDAQRLIHAFRELWEEDEALLVLEGETLISTGKPTEAISCIERGLALNSSSYELYFMLGEAYELLGNPECAELCYRYSIYQCHDGGDITFLKENLDRFTQTFGHVLPKLSILLTVSGNPDWLKLCLQILPLFTMRDHYEILFLEAHPTKGLHALLEEQTVGKVVSCRPEVLSALYNLAIEQADPRADIVIIDEGGLPLEHTLFNLQLELYRTPEAGAAGSISSHPACARYMKRSCPSADDAMNYAHQYNIPDHTAPVSSLDLPGPVYMLKRSFLKRYGWFDPDFSLRYYQLKDYFFRLIDNGKKVLLCPNSLAILTVEYPIPWDSRELELFKKKRGVNLTYSCFARGELVSLIQRVSGGESLPMNVLEIGCACGATLIEIKRCFPGAALYGIELDEGPASIAGHFASVSNENIEGSSLDYPEEFFDYVIFGDVLEHLRDPGKVLTTMKNYLKPDGVILASIPNVMHISVVKPLLGGFWTYEDAGILDRTHLKFFTYQEILRLFQTNGYRVETASATAVPISEEDGKLITTLAGIQNVPESWFQAYQYLITAKKE